MMRWYNLLDVLESVQCANRGCHSVFKLRDIVSRRKCPNCKLTNARCFKPPREPLAKRAENG
jgi:hypothetical protein